MKRNAEALVGDFASNTKKPKEAYLHNEPDRSPLSESVRQQIRNHIHDKLNDIDNGFTNKENLQERAKFLEEAVFQQLNTRDLNSNKEYFSQVDSILVELEKKPPATRRLESSMLQNPCTRQNQLKTSCSSTTSPNDKLLSQQDYFEFQNMCRQYSKEDLIFQLWNERQSCNRHEEVVSQLKQKLEMAEKFQQSPSVQCLDRRFAKAVEPLVSNYGSENTRGQSPSSRQWTQPTSTSSSENTSLPYLLPPWKKPSMPTQPILYSNAHLATPYKYIRPTQNAENSSSGMNSFDKERKSDKHMSFQNINECFKLPLENQNRVDGFISPQELQNERDSRGNMLSDYMNEVLRLEKKYNKDLLSVYQSVSKPSFYNEKCEMIKKNVRLCLSIFNECKMISSKSQQRFINTDDFTRLKSMERFIVSVIIPIRTKISFARHRKDSEKERQINNSSCDDVKTNPNNQTISAQNHNNPRSKLEEEQKVLVI